MKLQRLTLLCCIALLFLLTTSQADAGYKRWTFAGSAEGWSGVPGVAWSAGMIVLGPDPSARMSDPGFSSAAQSFNYCKFVGVNTGSYTTGHFYVKYAGQANFTEAQKTTFNFPHRNYGETWSRIVFRIDVVGGWSTGQISQIRIDPARPSTANTYYDHIVLGYDNQAPTVSSFGASPSGWTSTNSFTVTVNTTDPPSTNTDHNVETFGSGTNNIQMRAANGSWQTIWSYQDGVLPDPVQVGKSGALAYQQGTNTYYVRVTDNVGHSTERTVNYYYDSQAPGKPTASVNPIGWSASSSFTFSWNNPGDVGSGVKSYEWRIDGGSVHATTSTSATTTIAQGCHNFEVRAVDYANNKGAWSTIIQACYDGTSPGTPDPSCNPTGWTATNNFQFCWNNPGDAHSGISHYQWRVDGGGTSTTASTCITRTTSEGSHTFEVRAVDNVGRVSSWDNVPFYYDATPPGTPVPVADPTGWGGLPARPISWANPGDVTSGIDHYDWRVDGGVETSTTGTSVAVTIPEGCATVQVRAVDRAGNESAWGNVYICYDGTLPDLTLTRVNLRAIVTPGEHIALSSGIASFCGRADDYESGLAIVEAKGSGNSYGCSSSDWFVVDDSTDWCWTRASLSGRNRFYFRAVDSVGHVSDSDLAWVEICIDVDAPQTSLTLDGYSKSGFYVAPVDLILTSEDNLSGACDPCGSGTESIRYRLDGANLSIYESPFEITQAGEHLIVVFARDSLGNEEDPWSQSFNVLVRGDTNWDLAVNSSDIIYLVNYVFKSGPEPEPFSEVGDVNCDGTINSSDIIFLVNYVFKGGPKPCEER